MESLLIVKGADKEAEVGAGREEEFAKVGRALNDFPVGLEERELNIVEVS